MKSGYCTIMWNGRESGARETKAGLHPKKVMLCIWWDWKGVLYYELLPEDQTINSNKYCSQLDQLKASIDEKHPELVIRKTHNLPSEHHKTACFFDDQAKTVTASDCLGGSDSSAVFTRHCTFRFPFISVFIKYS